MTPTELKSELKKHKITQWVLAQKMGIHEKTLVCWLHTPELTEERSNRVKSAISEILREREK